jgi:hypothetical protein
VQYVDLKDGQVYIVFANGDCALFPQFGEAKLKFILLSGSPGRHGGRPPGTPHGGPSRLQRMMSPYHVSFVRYDSRYPHFGHPKVATRQRVPLVEGRPRNPRSGCPSTQNVRGQLTASVRNPSRISVAHFGQIGFVDMVHPPWLCGP